jgi:O-antigen biosynthesis protein WbqP
MKRLFDFFFTIILILLLLPIFLIVYISIFFLDKFNPLYFSKRIGKNNKIFLMPKFRTMKKNTPQKATNKLKNADKYITSLGKILRKSSFDELPQLFSVLFGHMSLVGPRPALYNQKTLIKLRTLKKIHLMLPGITGLAQIKGRDNLTVKEKVYYDEIYFKNKSIVFDLKIILDTVSAIIKIKSIKH